VLLIGLSETLVSCYTLILVTKPSEFFNVVTTVAIPMIVFNVIGMAIFAMVVNNILDEKNIQRKIQLLEVEVESKRNLSAIINTISHPVYVLDRDQRFVLVNDSFCRFIGRLREDILKKTPRDFFPEGDLLFYQDMTDEDIQNQTSREREVTITIPDGQKCTIISTSTVFTDAPCPGFVVGVIQDITERKRIEMALRETNENLKEENAQRLEAEGKLQKSYDEKVILLQEVHHRVKNNLQIIISLLNLQSRYIKDEPTLAAIKDSQNRVRAMALVHEKLYRSEDISFISLEDYVKFLGTGLFQTYDARSRGILFTMEIHNVDVDIDVAIPLGLLINELIANSLKYAFPDDRKGEIFVGVKKEGNTLTILFRDTGIGIPADLDWRNVPSLGLRLVTTLVDQMDGTVELDRSAGTSFTIVVKERK